VGTEEQNGVIDPEVLWACTNCGPCVNECPVDIEHIEALALDPDTITTACPYCTVMLSDAVNAKKAAGQAKQTLEVIDVAQLLVRSVRLRRAGGEGGEGGEGRTAPPAGDTDAAS
jgi:Fe-S oxidoreductase